MVFVHKNGLCESTKVGEGSRVWAFAHVLPGAEIGKDCNICDHVFIENDVVIGDRVTIKCGVQVWDGVRLENDVFIGPNATFTNDVFPRSKVYPTAFAHTVVKEGASLGANCTILPGLTIGTKAMVGAGAVVTRNVPPNAIVVGNPARIVGYVDSRTADPELDSESKLRGKWNAKETKVAGVQLHEFPVFDDMRGSLSVGEFERQVPFMPKRYFLVFDVPSAEVRGEHAHRECHQFLICLRGSCAVMADDGNNRQEWKLSAPTTGVYLPPMTWGVHYKYSKDAILLVFASHQYDANDYIRDYDVFLKEVPRQPRG
jgi:UDP-2-acetamido-3-amino-2,3-dideoxy-glucuronate N-acetyltransferase